MNTDTKIDDLVWSQAGNTDLPPIRWQTGRMKAKAKAITITFQTVDEEGDPLMTRIHEIPAARVTQGSIPGLARYVQKAAADFCLEALLVQDK